MKHENLRIFSGLSAKNHMLHTVTSGEPPDISNGEFQSWDGNHTIDARPVPSLVTCREWGDSSDCATFKPSPRLPQSGHFSVGIHVKLLETQSGGVIVIDHVLYPYLPKIGLRWLPCDSHLSCSAAVSKCRTIRWLLFLSQSTGLMTPPEQGP